MLRKIGSSMGDKRIMMSQKSSIVDEIINNKMMGRLACIVMHLMRTCRWQKDLHPNHKLM